ncbi:MAG: ABC transporter ATP-binding protein [Rubrobacteraceae bacterium]|nr:ABC transporter ATP-binding protein [Rubrobacteraceae bacterium]
MKLEVENVVWGAEGQKILRGVSLEVGPGEVVGLIGPNGSGKTSLLRCVYKVLKPQAGLISLGEEDVLRTSVRRMARRTAVVPQETPGEFDFTVREIVAMGRSPHKGLFERETAGDLEIVEDSLARVGMLPFAGRQFRTLSGGEKQKILVARALAQRAKLLVLDEPTTHLDVGHQLEVLELVKNLRVSTLAALHDLNLAALFCDRLHVLHGGEIFASGSPEEVLTPRLIREVYGVASEVDIHPATGKPHVVFVPEGLRLRLNGHEGEQEGRRRGDVSP